MRRHLSSGTRGTSRVPPKASSASCAVRRPPAHPSVLSSLEATAPQCCHTAPRTAWTGRREAGASPQPRLRQALPDSSGVHVHIAPPATRRDSPPTGLARCTPDPRACKGRDAPPVQYARGAARIPCLRPAPCPYRASPLAAAARAPTPARALAATWRPSVLPRMSVEHWR
jgi:hypothetical protein